ncbi:MAG: hypothetical protein Roseis2KO_49270 [Roseivirga sp.]
MKWPKYTLLLLFVLLYACRDAFDFDYPDVLAPVVVIDGYVTDNGKAHVVQVSYSTTINNRGLVETEFVTDADVRIVDDQGGFTVLNHRQSGRYFTAPQYTAREGVNYQLVVTLSNGEVYESAIKTLPAPSPAVADLSFKRESQDVLSNNRVLQEEGALIEATIQKDGNRHFYQWVIGQYFIIESDAAPDELKFCYIRDFDEPRVVLLQDNPAQDGITEYTYPIEFVPRSAKMKIDFGVEGVLLTLKEEDFQFWDAVRQQAENSGSLFDAAPHSIEGNISGRNGQRALGYFGVYRESVDRVFFTEGELGFSPGTYPPCNSPASGGANPCTDCRLHEYQENFGIFAPDWWRN